MLNDQLRQIIRDCLNDFNAFSNPIKVSPAVPILWFGDLDAYWESDKRIVTVALNPSEIEFTSNRPKVFSIETRFPGLLATPSPDDYYKSMISFTTHI